MILKPMASPALTLFLFAGLALFGGACRNNSPTNTGSTAVPVAFTFQNNLNANIIQLDLIGYPNGIYYTFGVSAPSGANTVFNFKVPAGTYTVNIIDAGHQYDYWGPTAIGSGNNFSLIVNPGSATLDSAVCNPCGF